MQNILFSFGLIILTGVVFRRLMSGKLDVDSVRLAINALVLNIFLPALCIHTLSSALIDREAFLVPVSAWITTILSLVAAVSVYSLLSRRLKMKSEEKGVLVLSAAFGNVTYLGLPVLTGLYGAEAAKYALFYDLLATTPILWLFGASLAAHYGEGKKLSLWESLRTIISLPPLWGIFAGLILNWANLQVPFFIMKPLEMFGSLVVPLMIFSIGLALSVPRIQHAYIVIPAVFIKLAIVPVIALFSARLLGLTGETLAACFIEGGMPTMVLSLLIAAKFRLDVSLSAFTILITTILSFFSLPFIVYLTGYLGM